MIARFDVVSHEPWLYRRLFWVCGMLVHVLYLEAEAAGVRSTGIGCFFDDEMHALLGIGDQSWQSLYHFTLGGAVDDTRLSTLPRISFSLEAARRWETAGNASEVGFHCSPHSGWPMVLANSVNMTLKLMLILGSSLWLASTECSSQAGKMTSVPISTATTT